MPYGKGTYGKKKGRPKKKMKKALKQVDKDVELLFKKLSDAGFLDNTNIVMIGW